MEFEIHYTRKIEADDFFDAVEKTKELIDGVEEVIAVNPWVEEDFIDDDIIQ